MNVCTDLKHRLPHPELGTPFFWTGFLRGLVDHEPNDVDREWLAKFDAWQTEYDHWQANYNSACVVCCPEDEQ